MPETTTHVHICYFLPQIYGGNKEDRAVMCDRMRGDGLTLDEGDRRNNL